MGTIRVGIGGWNYEPWRQTFYPADLPAKRELEYASRKLTAIEVNGTFYATQSASSYERWHDETPEGFRFALKAHRFTTQRKVLAEGAESVQHFLNSGPARLRDKLGPILWQFNPHKRFDADDVDAFLKLLPRELEGRPLRHVIEARHESFLSPRFVDLLRAHGAAAVVTDSTDYPSFADLTADFVYLRLLRCEAERETGYAPEVLDAWAACAKTWAEGGEPAGVPRIEPEAPAPRADSREVYVFMINGAKERAPAAAMGVIERLQRDSAHSSRA
jgi:uncharacterized protein YecE (DUF72 family)